MSVTFCNLNKASLLQFKNCVLLIFSDNMCPRNRASYLTHDITCHYYRRVSSWVMWLCMLRTMTSLPKQPFAFYIFSQRFSPQWPIRTCSMITAVQFAMHWWW